MPTGDPPAAWTVQYPKFDPEAFAKAIAKDTRSPMVRALELLEPLDVETRDRILLALCRYFGHTVDG